MPPRIYHTILEDTKNKFIPKQHKDTSHTDLTRLGVAARKLSSDTNDIDFPRDRADTLLQELIQAKFLELFGDTWTVQIGDITLRGYDRVHSRSLRRYPDGAYSVHMFLNELTRITRVCLIMAAAPSISLQSYSLAGGTALR